MPYQELPVFMTLLRQREALSARLLEFVIMTACRQSEARLATHDEIDKVNRIWTIPASRMKTNREHRVPLTDRMLEIIDVCETDSHYLFAERGKPLSINALRMLMNRMAVGKYTPHGFRSSFREWCEEKSIIREESIWEESLGHLIGTATTRCYRRNDAIDARLRLLKHWNLFASKA